MSDNSKISWTDATLPIVVGCDKVSPGCRNCWAIRDAWRMGQNPNPKISGVYGGLAAKDEQGRLDWTGVVRLLPDRLRWPLAWQKPRTIFVCSSSDLFHDEVPFWFIAQAFRMMTNADRHRYIILTKRPERALEFQAKILPGAYDPSLMVYSDRSKTATAVGLSTDWPPRNVAFGVSVENQVTLLERLPLLARVNLGATRWLSIEPQLSEIDMGLCEETPVDAIVVGGESGPILKVRGFDWQWAESLLEWSDRHGVRFHMKQVGSRLARELGYKSKHGSDPAEWPERFRRRDSIFG